MKPKYSMTDVPVKTISCCCGYTVPADRDGRAILRYHQSGCDRFKGVVTA